MTNQPKRRRPRQLSARDIRFCQLHVERGRGHTVACWLDAGFEPRASPSVTYQAANNLLHNPEIRAYCDVLRGQAADAARVTLTEAIAAVRALALADRRAVFDEHGRVRPPHEWPADLAAAVDQVETKELFEPVRGAEGEKELKGYARKVKFGSKLAALVKLVELAGLIRPGASTAPVRNATVVEVAIGPETVEPPPPWGGDAG